MRSLWNDLWLLWYEYKRQRSLHPRWRRLELVRAGLESLGGKKGESLFLVGGDEYVIVEREWINDKLVKLDRLGGDPEE